MSRYFYFVHSGVCLPCTPLHEVANVTTDGRNQQCLHSDGSMPTPDHHGLNMNSTRIITYSLKPGSPNSDEYYRTVSAFVDAWLARAMPGLQDLLDGFREYRQGRGEADR